MTVADFTWPAVAVLGIILASRHVGAMLERPWKAHEGLADVVKHLREMDEATLDRVKRLEMLMPERK